MGDVFTPGIQTSSLQICAEYEEVLGDFETSNVPEENNVEQPVGEIHVHVTPYVDEGGFFVDPAGKIIDMATKGVGIRGGSLPEGQGRLGCSLYDEDHQTDFTVTTNNLRRDLPNNVFHVPFSPKTGGDCVFKNVPLNVPVAVAVLEDNNGDLNQNFDTGGYVPYENWGVSSNPEELAKLAGKPKVPPVDFTVRPPRAYFPQASVMITESNSEVTPDGRRILRLTIGLRFT